MNASLAGLQFGAGIFVGPDLVADGHGSVLGRAAPIARASGLKRNRTIHIADARGARRRIAFICPRHRRGEAQETGENQKQAEPAANGSHVLHHS